MIGIQDIKSLLNIPTSIVIISHRNPDGDALGSSLALSQFLKQFGHIVDIVLPSEFPTIFDFLQGADAVNIYDRDNDGSTHIISKAKVIFCLDFNALDRIDKMGELITQSNATKIMIDHHLDPEPFVDYYLSDQTASSTAELVYKFIELLGMLKYLTIPMGEALLTGIITDTGSFKYATNPYVYYVAGKLKELGVDDYKLQDRIFNSMTEKQLRLLGHCLANRMEIIENGKVGIVALNKSDYFDYTIERGDTEGIVNYLLMVYSVEMAIFVREQPSIIKFSFRSKGNISVQELARDHFKGGGHKNASGGATYGSLKKAISKLKEVIPTYLNNN